MGFGGLAFDVVAWLASLLIKTYMMSLRIYVDRGFIQALHRPEGPIIGAFWHGHMLLPLFVCRHLPIAILVSRSRDGERIAQVARHFGMGAVRGSTSRGASVAVKELLEVARGKITHLAFTPDGPRGPRHQVAPGVIYLAQRSGLPILPVAVGLDRYWVLPSKWDEFLLPKPFARAVVRADDLYLVPGELSDEQLEEHRLELQRRLLALTRATYTEARRSDLADDPTLVVVH